jgi:lipopolysaccharide transport system ATP-binding protein
MSVVIRVENVSKRYRLGVINRQMLYQDLQSRWARWRGRPDPNAPLHAKHSRDDGDTHEEFWALRDVSFEVRDGESVGIIGSNGAGKSTLLKILSEITAPTSGRALMKGRVASLLEVGTGFHPELTGRENVFLNGAILGMNRAEIAGKFDQIVDFSGVEQFIDTPVKRYSSGMRVRLAFAVAAHLQPEILIVDEVLAVGDVAFQEKCLTKMDESCRSGRTILFVSHNMTALDKLCRRGLVLENGRIVFDGTQTGAIEKYLEQNAGDPADLSAQHNRRGSGEILVSKVELGNRDGHKTTAIRAGEECRISLHYDKRTTKHYPNLTVAVIVSTNLDVPVFAHHNQLAGQLFGALPGAGVFVCSIPNLPLAAGSYHLRFRIKSDMLGGDALDGINDPIPFTVTGGDFHGSGVHLHPSFGCAQVKADWHVEPPDEQRAAEIA